MTFSYDFGAGVVSLVFEPATEPCGYLENGDILRISKATHLVAGCRRGLGAACFCVVPRRG